MADVSAEPSMEEILSSIKRIIAEEEGAPPRRRAPARTASAEADDEPEGERTDDTILELSQPMEPAPMASRPFSPPPIPSQAVHAAAPAPAAIPAPVVEAPVAVDPAPAEPGVAEPAQADPAVEPIVSPKAADATRGSLESLSRMIVRPSASGGEETLEGLVRELLKPMLRDWLDARLPEIVETMVAREIARISGRDA